MEGVLVQDWISLTADGAIDSLVQDASAWLDLEAYQDLVLWTEVRRVAGSTNVDLYFQASPSRDESLFSDVGRVPLSADTKPSILKVVRDFDPIVPLARWLRWKLVPNGGSTTVWGATFRVHCAINRISGAVR